MKYAEKRKKLLVPHKYPAKMRGVNWPKGISPMKQAKACQLDARILAARPSKHHRFILPKGPVNKPRESQ